MFNKNIFKNQEKISTRDAFGEALLLLGESNPNVVAITADLSESVRMNKFKEKFPDRFFDLGIAEQNMAGVASGFSAMGKIPIMASYAIFSPGRNWEQIRTTICYNKRPVIIVGSHAGLSVGPDGGSHQALEDIALTRVLPGMTVISPIDTHETKKALFKATSLNSPVYMRLSRDKTPIMTEEETPFEIGQVEIFYESQENSDVGIIATGPILYKALEAIELLEKENITVKVLNVSTIKPFPEKQVVDFAKKVKALVTLEEHQIIGGLGSAVSECLAKNLPKPIEFVGVQDSFGQSGKPEELFDFYGLSVSDVVKASKKVLSRINA